MITRLEPVILALERERQPLLIVAHQAVLRALYAYLMDRPAEDCPRIDMPLHTLIQLTPTAYGCDERRYPLAPAPLDQEGLPQRMTARAESPDDALARAAELLRGRRIAALTGAGCSTESGIPDYRGTGTLARARSPIQGRELARDPMTRRRYWARALLGWERFAAAAPNAAHRALVDLEGAGALTGLVTQNVDRLHHAAGSRRVVELHGALAEVRCTDCGARDERAAVQRRLRIQNPGFEERVRRTQDVRAAPDGDAELPPDAHANFVLPTCGRCGGDRLRPDVVLFGENVARPVVDEAFAIVDEAEGLLVVGSSLTVYSGLRFVRRAAERAMPVVIVNLGPTRGDELAALRVDRRAGEALPALAAALRERAG